MSREAILATLEDYARAYCDQDIDAMMLVFDDSDDISVIGTGADELCSGRTEVRELFRRNFREAHAKHFEWEWICPAVSEDFAVVAVTLTIDLDLESEEIRVPLRWSVALRRRGSRWVWVHRHASTAATNQGSGNAYPDATD